LFTDIFNTDVPTRYGLEKNWTDAWRNKTLANGTYVNTLDTVQLARGIYKKLQSANLNVRRKYEAYKNPTREKFNKMRKM